MMKENTAARTMEVVAAEIKANVTAFNLTEEPAEKNKLELALKTLENEYNELSLLNTWASFMTEDIPMVAFAKAYDYPVIGHKDVDSRKVENGVKTIVRTRVVDETKTRMLTVKDFVEWTEESGACVAHDKHWRKAVNAARDSVIDQWKGFMGSKGDTRTVSIGKMTKALQEMVDALVFVEGEKGGNAVKVKRDIAKAVFALCNQRKDGLKGSIMSESVWKKLQVDVLHAAVSGKDFTISYGDEDDTTDAGETPASEAKTESDNK